MIYVWGFSNRGCFFYFFFVFFVVFCFLFFWWPNFSSFLVLQDIKPANILLDEAGEAFVADFGIARLMEGTQLSMTSAAGTFNYMAPELFDENAPKTFAVDVWGSGCVVIEMLTGEPPFHGLPLQVCVFCVCF